MSAADRQTITPAEYLEITGGAGTARPGRKPGGNKYGAKSAYYNGTRYDSTGEAKRAEDLDFLIAAKQILDWIRQPKVELGQNDITYRPDFLVIPRPGNTLGVGDTPWYEDFKGVQTPDFTLKKKLWRRCGRLPLRITKLDKRRFVVVETIEPGANA